MSFRLVPYTEVNIQGERHQQAQQGDQGGAANGEVDDDLQAAPGIEVRGEIRVLAQTVCFQTSDSNFIFSYHYLTSPSGSGCVFHSTEVCELVPELIGKVKTLARLSTVHRKSLYRANTRSDFLHHILKK